MREDIETQKTILFGLELREEELIEEIRKLEHSEKVEIRVKKDNKSEELEKIRESIKKRKLNHTHLS